MRNVIVIITNQSKKSKLDKLKWASKLILTENKPSNSEVYDMNNWLKIAGLTSLPIATLFAADPHQISNQENTTQSFEYFTAYGEFKDAMLAKSVNGYFTFFSGNEEFGFRITANLTTMRSNETFNDVCDVDICLPQSGKKDTMRIYFGEIKKDSDLTKIPHALHSESNYRAKYWTNPPTKNENQ
jgi:hypothetical protein